MNARWDQRGTDLFTFWPPGPLERLKEISPIRRGMVLELRFFSHSLASSRSESADLVVVEANRRSVGQNESAILGFRKKERTTTGQRLKVEPVDLVNHA